MDIDWSVSAWAVGSFVIGILLGHKLQLGRDRRKERIAAVAPIRAWIIHRVRTLGAPPWKRPDAAEVDAYTSRLSPRQRKRFLAAWNRLGKLDEAAVGPYDPEHGTSTYTGSEEISRLAMDLARMTLHQ